MRQAGTWILAAILMATGTAVADEGMWMLHQMAMLNRAELKAMGLEMTPDQLWNPATGEGLASATVSIGGCSASFVSPQGLIATNHHCAFRAIQSNSSPENDYIRDGFLAHSFEEELEATEYRTFVFLGYEEVTRQITGGLAATLAPEERVEQIERRQKELTAACEADGTRCRVAEMFGGRNYYLFRTLELRDVRLVHAPPRSVGEYGGETDNWMWPRHTGDYSFLRAYIGPDGMPADFSPDNVPYQPKRWLTVAQAPLREGDFVMILGYPGRTMRYRPATAVAQDTEFGYPERITLLREWIDILEERGRTSREVEIKLASRMRGLQNGYKNSQGMLEGLQRFGLAHRKLAQEKALADWIAADSGRRAAYGGVLPAINELVAGQGATRERDLLLGLLSRGSSLLSAAITIERWADERGKEDLDRKAGFQDRDALNVRQRLSMIQRDLDMETERALLTHFFNRALALPANQRIGAVDAVVAVTGRSGQPAVEAAVQTLLGGTALGRADRRLALLESSHRDLLAAGDPLIKFAAALRVDTDAMDAASRRVEGAMNLLMPRMFNAMEAWQERPLYPDANSTLRFTYATVTGYSPRDGVLYLPFTTLKGVVAKNTGEEPFDAPLALLQAAARPTHPSYLDEILGDVPSCFTSTNDITGGNSGSPVMNGRGELVGLAFDGNYEAMTSDFLFDSDLSRTISVDARYMLWVMDYVDRAHNLMREMGIEPKNVE